MSAVFFQVRKRQSKSPIKSKIAAENRTTKDNFYYTAILEVTPYKEVIGKEG